MAFVKICGLTNVEDACFAESAGADLLGFVNAQNSPRYLSPDEISRIIRELNPRVPTVLVSHSIDTTEILNNFEAAETDILQVHSPLTFDEYLELKERVPFVIANISIPAELEKSSDALKTRTSKLSSFVDYILFDTLAGTEIGGTGKTYDWSVAADLKAHSKVPIIIAGGLNPSNVEKAISISRPYAVDVSSGIERSIGEKDETMVASFIKRAKSLL